MATRSFCNCVYCHNSVGGLACGSQNWAPVTESQIGVSILPPCVYAVSQLKTASYYPPGLTNQRSIAGLEPTFAVIDSRFNGATAIPASSYFIPPSDNNSLLSDQFGGGLGPLAPTPFVALDDRFSVFGPQSYLMPDQTRRTEFGSLYCANPMGISSGGFPMRPNELLPFGYTGSSPSRRPRSEKTTKIKDSSMDSTTQ